MDTVVEKKKPVLYRFNREKLKELHAQLNIMAEKTGIPEDYFHKKYNKKIASRASVTRAKSVTKITDRYISHCKKVIDTYDSIVESNILNPQEEEKLKGKDIPPYYLLLIAEEISSYPKFKAIDKLRGDKEKFKDDLELLKRIKKIYRFGMYADIRKIIDKRIDYLESHLRNIDRYFESLVFTPTINSMIKVNLRPSRAQYKNISLTYLLSCIYVIIKVTTNLSNSTIHEQIASIYQHIEELPPISKDEKISVEVISRRLSKSRNYGIVQSYLYALRSRRSKPIRKSAFPNIADIFDVKYDPVRTKKIYRRLGKRLKSFAEN